MPTMVSIKPFIFYHPSCQSFKSFLWFVFGNQLLVLETVQGVWRCRVISIRENKKNDCYLVQDKSCGHSPTRVVIRIFCPAATQHHLVYFSVSPKTACVFLHVSMLGSSTCPGKLRYHESMGFTWIWMWNVGVASASNEARYSGWLGGEDGMVKWIGSTPTT